MLSGIANYLFGASSSTVEEGEVPANVETPSNHDNHQDEAKLRLSTPTDDAEWVLVDKSNSGMSSMEASQISLDSMADSVHSLLDAQQLQLAIVSRSIQELSRLGGELSSVNSSRASSGMSSPVHVIHPSLGESWLVTPPPCFTAAGSGLTPGELEKHPMEDLLIEHPSMSVYGPRGRPSSTGHDSDSSSPGDTGAGPQRVGPQAGRAVAPRQHRPRTLLAAKASLKATMAATRSMQRSTKRHEQRRHAKSAMQRSNQVAHHNARPYRQRRKDHQLTPSGRSNNRNQH